MCVRAHIHAHEHAVLLFVVPSMAICMERENVIVIGSERMKNVCSCELLCSVLYAQSHADACVHVAKMLSLEKRKINKFTGI